MAFFDRFYALEVLSEHYDVTVYKARSKKDKQTYILKVLHCFEASDAQKKKFSEEYKIANNPKLQHAAKVVAFYEDDTISAIVFEYVLGLTLSAMIHNAHLTLKEQLTIALHLCEAVMELHDLDIVHKDISPSNIIVDSELKQLTLIDYGLSVDLQIINEEAVKDGVFALSQGTIHYIAPEMTGRIDRPIDFRSDIYAMGSLFYELFCGHTAFESNNFNDLIYMQIAVVPKSLTALKPDFPRILSDIVMKCMQKEPQNRYQSVFGLYEDLLRIDVDFEEIDTLEFKIAQDDIQQKFVYDGIIVGREKVLDALAHEVERIRDGKRRALFISGDSGTGKSTIVKHFKETIFEQGGSFLEVKIDQYQKHTPFYIWVSILGRYYDLIVSELSVKRVRIVKKISEELDGYLEIFMTLAPDYQNFFTSFETQNNYGGLEQQEAFIYKAIVDFFKLLATFYKAQYFFIDDLQWADPDSLQILEQLIQEPGLEAVAFICTYRSNEVEKFSYLDVFLARAVKLKEANTFVLQKLEKKDVDAFVSHYIKKRFEDQALLVDLIFERSKGNPFSMRWFFSLLVDKHLIYFDTKHKSWQWDRIGIEKIVPSNDALDLILKELVELPVEVKQLFGFAAMTGNHLDEKLLLEVSGIEKNQKALETLLKEGVLKGFLRYEEEQYYFSHDRFQEFFYRQIDEEMQRALKSRTIDYFVEKGLLYSKRYIFMALDFLQALKSGFEKRSEHTQFLALSLEAIKIAKASASFENIREILESSRASKEMLDLENQSEYALCFRHDLESALVYYLLGDYEKSNAYIQMMDTYVADEWDEIEIFSLKKRLLATQTKDISLICEAGIRLGEVLAIPLSHYEDETLVDAFHQDIQKALRNVEVLSKLPLLENDKLQKKMRFLMDFWEVAYYAENELLMRWNVLYMVNFSLEDGNCQESAFAYVLYGAQLAYEENYELAYKVGYSGVELNQHFKDLEQLPKVYNLFCNYINPLYKPWESSIVFYKESINQSIKNGDKVFGIWAVYLQKWSYLFSAMGLDNLEMLSREHQEFLFSAKDLKMQDAYKNFQIFFKHLRDAQIDQRDPYIQEPSFKPAQSWNAILESIEHLIFGRYEKACSLLSDPNLEDNVNIVMFPALFIACVQPIVCLKSEKFDQKSLEVIEEKLEKLKRLSRQNPDNFLVFYLLVKAELMQQKSDHDHWEVIALYKLAIQQSSIYGQLFLRALSSELFAHYWVGRNEEKHKEYLKKAYTGYENWGAVAKCEQLKAEYGTWISYNAALAPKKALYGSSHQYAHSTAYEHDFDLQTILRATEVISAELDITKLLELLSEIMLKYSGAQELSLFTCNKGAWALVESFTQLEVDSFEEKELPEKVLNYIYFERKNLFIDDLKEAYAFNNDHYFKNSEAKSLLAMPLLDKNNNVVMALVAQNFLLTSAFSYEHENALHYLMRQAWTSLENAKLVSELEAELEAHKKLDKRVTLLGDILQKSPLMVMVCNEAGLIEYVNDAFCEITGFNELEVMGKKPSILKSEQQASHYYTDLWQTIKKGKIWKGELINRKKDGTIYHEHQTISPLFDEAGILTHYVAFKEDISEKKAQEKFYFMQSRQAQLGEMLSMIAHQWRQPLSSINAIVINNRFKSSLGSLNEEDILKSYIKIEELVSHLSETIDDFRNFFKPNKTRTNVEIAHLLEKTNELLSATLLTNDVTLELALEACDPIETYDKELMQVFMNIIKNSIDHLILRAVTSKKILVRNFQRGGKIHIEISDNAGGIPEADLSEIFLPYFSTKSEKQGTGLGLYMSKTIVEEHCGGSITARNSEEGAVFEIILDVKQ